MIGWLSGTVRSVSDDRIILETHGVGYEVFVSPRFLAGHSALGKEVSVFIHTHVREDNLSLFGFETLEEKNLFLLLNTVSGIGAKTAMSILSALPPSRLVQAIRAKELGLLQQTPGIGKKTAERLVMELRDKLEKLPTTYASDSSIPAPKMTAAQDLVSALVNLGYKLPQAESAVSQVELSKFDSFDRMLKETLKVLSK